VQELNSIGGDAIVMDRCPPVNVVLQLMDIDDFMEEQNTLGGLLQLTLMQDVIVCSPVQGAQTLPKDGTLPSPHALFDTPTVKPSAGDHLAYTISTNTVLKAPVDKVQVIPYKLHPALMMMGTRPRKDATSHPHQPGPRPDPPRPDPALSGRHAKPKPRSGPHY
jgi:hypothetical protein